MNQQEFKLNQHVMLNGARGKIVDIYRPMGTYPMFKVQLFTDGTFHNVAKYQLVKSLPDTLIGNFPATESENENPSTDSVSINCRSTAATTISIEPISSSSIESIATTSSSMSNNPVSSRFIEINDDQYQQFRKSTENRQTKRKTDSHLNLLLKYLAEKGETREIFDIPPFELDYHLSRFIVCVRQKGGNEYEPTTLRGIIGSIERHLKDIKYGYSILQSNEFHETRTSLKSKQKDLRSKGKGNRPMQSDTITDQDIDTLYEMGQLGPHNPSSMINTLWFFNTLQFGIRAGGQEHRRIRWGDINLKFDDELDTEYLEYNERQTKTRTGENVTNIREQCPRIYAFEDNWDRCPVECFKAYSDKRPHGYSAPEDPFYIAPVTNTTNPAESERWFLRQPIGPNKLETLMKRMAEKADLPSLKTKKITNTSVRKYLCQKLLNNNIPDTHAIHITGHKNTDSLNNYRRISNKQQHDLSTLLSNTTGHTTGSGSYNNNNNPHISRPAAIVSKSHTTSTNNVHGVATAGNVTMPVLSPRNLHLDPPNDQMTSSVFCNSVIQGGSFTININYNTKKIHPRRPHVIHSSDSE